MAVQVRCPYCKEVLHIQRSEFDIEVLCPRCGRGFVWRKVLEARERERRELEERRRKLEEQQRQCEDAVPPVWYVLGGLFPIVGFVLGIIAVAKNKRGELAYLYSRFWRQFFGQVYTTISLSMSSSRVSPRAYGSRKKSQFPSRLQLPCRNL